MGGQPTGNSHGQCSARGNHRLSAAKEAECGRVKHVPDSFRRLPRVRSRVRALQYDSELEARKYTVPADSGEVARRAFSVSGDDLRGRWQAASRRQPAARPHAWLIGDGPGREQPAEVEERVADRAHLPV